MSERWEFLAHEGSGDVSNHFYDENFVHNLGNCNYMAVLTVLMNM